MLALGLPAREADRDFREMLEPGRAFGQGPFEPPPELWARDRACAQLLIRDYEYRGLMEEADREVLEFIGDQGKTAEQVSDRFPVFDLERLVRAELARPRRTNPVKSQSSHIPADEHTFYVLTSRGAEAIGLAPYTLHSD